ncbi:MAG: hypothetical protein QOD75_2902 [Blastocatellia bacterium]|jgi:hypothetical protein|nr:hypothetical protein [Blastocatellia bacterium]
MSSRLSVIFYIILCFEIGLLLACLPWIPQGLFGLSDWSNNYFLVLATRKSGFYGLQSFVASGWVRGAVSGVGILNIGMAVWETIHFRDRVRALQQSSPPNKVAAQNATQKSQTDPLSDYPRRHDGGNSTSQ